MVSVNVDEKLKDYYGHVKENIEKIIREESENIEQASKHIVKALKNGNKIWGYGPGHANEFIQTMLCTPAGIPFINSIFPYFRETIHDNVEGLGEMLGRQTPFTKGDVFLFVSISGKHPLPIEIVQYAKSLGVYTIGLTSVTYSTSSKPNNKWGKLLYEVVDLCFDNHVDIGDACVNIEGAPDKVAPVSGVMSMFIAELLMASIAEEMEKEKIEFPVFRHPNLPNNKSHNESIAKNCKWVNYF